VGRFIVLKYLSLGLNAARALILAAVLGPVSFGYLGTLVAVQQYLSYAALGMREGLTVRLAQPAAGRESAEAIQSSALAWALSVGIAVACALQCWAWATGRLPSPWSWVGVVAALSIVNEVLINISRDQHRLVRVGLMELCYNAAPLACVLYFGSDVTPTLVLESLAAGLVLSIAGHCAGVGGVRWSLATLATIRRLLWLGVPLAVSSFFSSSITSIYIFIANAMHIGKTIGLVVFANSLCGIVLFGANMVAWAATSQSMRRLADTSSPTADLRSERVTIFFQGAVLLSTLLLLLSGYLFLFALPAYRGAETYAVLFCLLQASGLLLYAELNFLAVRGHGRMIVIGYAIVLAATAASYAAMPEIVLTDLIATAIGVSAVLAIACTRMCQRLGLTQPFRFHLTYLLFPIACALAYRAGGITGALAVEAALLTLWLAQHGRRLVTALR
jgi:hypothetical protein